MAIKKTEFHADFNSVEKVGKNAQNSYWQERDRNMHFLLMFLLRL
jgi:hypothetical protein